MGTRAKVLLVESEPATAQRLARQMLQEGFEVLDARDAVGAIHTARREQPDVVVLDNQLAGGGGLAALQRIRSNVHTTHIPVVALLSRGGNKDRDVLLAAGAQECMALPSDPHQLVEAVRRNCLESLDFTQAPAAVIEAPARLEALRDTHLMDSPPEPVFDRLTALAARRAMAPVAILSLVDRDRQFFKSHSGLPPPLAERRQTRLTHSFCQWVVSGREALVIEDARTHPTLSKNLAVRELGVAAYAGFPIVGKDEQVLGSFCAIDLGPRAWTEQQLATLADLAKVSEAYVAQRSGSEMPLEARVLVAGRAIAAAAEVLRRHAGALEGDERTDLLAICQEQAQKVMLLSARPDARLNS